MTIVFSFVFSAFNSLTFSPAMARLFLRAKHGETRFFLFRWFNARPEVDRGLLRRVPRIRTARHWWTIVVPSLGLLALTGWMIAERPKAFIPTEDQGYLIVRGPDARRHQRRDDRRGRPARRGDLPGAGGGRAHGRARRPERDHLDQPDQLRRRLRAGSRTGTSGRRRSCGPPALAQKLQGKVAAKVRDAMVMVLQPPPIRGLSQTGGFELMIEDRAGKGVDALQQVVDRFQDEARKRPELAGVFSTFSARVPQLKFDVDRTKARRLDVPISDLFAILQANLGGYYVNDFNLYGKVWKVMVQAEGSVRTKPEDIAEPLRPEPQGGAGPAQLPGRGPLRPRADRRAPLQPVRRRQDQRRARPGLQLGPGDRRDAGGRRRGPARGVRLRVDRHDLPGAEDRQPGDLHLRPLGRLRLPVHGGPLRELDPARWSSS